MPDWATLWLDQPGIVWAVGAAAFLIAAALLAFVGYSVGSRGEVRPEARQSLAGENLYVTVPEGWQPTRPASSPVRLPLTGRIDAAAPAGGGWLVAGFATAKNRARLVSLLEAGTPQPPVTTDGLSLMRHRLPGLGATAAVVPADGGALVAFCGGREMSSGAAPACRNALASLVPSGLAIDDLPRKRELAGLAAVARPLGRLRARAGRAARAAESQRGQAKAFATLAAAHSLAARGLVRRTGNPSMRAVAARVREVGLGYGALSRAATSGSTATYGRARVRVRAADARLTAALRELRLLGVVAP